MNQDHGRWTQCAVFGGCRVLSTVTVWACWEVYCFPMRFRMVVMATMIVLHFPSCVRAISAVVDHVDHLLPTSS
jgi:hypothetical protein